MADFEKRLIPQDPFSVTLQGFENGAKITLLGDIHDRAPYRYFVQEFLERARDRFGSKRIVLGLEEDISNQRYLDEISAGKEIPTNLRTNILGRNDYEVDIDPPTWANEAYLKLLEYCSKHRVRLQACNIKGKSMALRELNMAVTLRELVENETLVVGFLGLRHVDNEAESSIRRILTISNSSLVWGAVLLDRYIRPESGILDRYADLFRHTVGSKELISQSFGLIDPNRPPNAIDAVVYLPWKRDEIPDFKKGLNYGN